MKAGAENRKKTVMLGAFGAAALGGVIYNLFALFGGSSTPPPTVAPLSSTPAPVHNAVAQRPGSGVPGTSSSAGAIGAIAGVNAEKLASTSSSLDPTLDQAAMLRTESLVYSGSGRNIFSASYTAAPLAAIPKNVPSARPIPIGPSRPIVPLGPPPPPPIPLKFFGTAQRGAGAKQVLLLSGEDVYLASVGDIVARRFKIVQIMPFGVQVTDLGDSNTQTLPLQQQ